MVRAQPRESPDKKQKITTNGNKPTDNCVRTATRTVGAQSRKLRPLRDGTVDMFRASLETEPLSFVGNLCAFRSRPRRLAQRLREKGLARSHLRARGSLPLLIRCPRATVQRAIGLVGGT